MPGIRLIVGLGNPGMEYESTRHNAGFWWVEHIAATRKAPFNAEKKFHGLAARVHLDGHEAWLLKPQTFMNRSGQAVGALAGFYKKGGGHGGHNGLKDIIAHLGTSDFWRLRIGIGHPGDKNQVADFVLRPACRAEQDLIDNAVDRSLPLLPHILAGNFSAAMLKLHTKAAK